MFVSKNTKTDVSLMRLGSELSSTALQGPSHQRSVGLRDICLILSSTTSFIDRGFRIGAGNYWETTVFIIKIHPGYYSKIISSIL